MTSPIRDWARAQGMQIGDRGLIAREIIDAYKVAHGIGLHRDRPVKPFVYCDRITKLWVAEIPRINLDGELLGWYSEKFDKHAYAFTFALRGPLTVDA